MAAPAPSTALSQPPLAAEKPTQEQVESGRRRMARSGSGGSMTLNTGARVGLALSQLLTILAFLVVLGALSSLQHRANQLHLSRLQRANPAVGASAIANYINNFQSAGQVPYPTDAKNQFSFQWYILALEIVVFLVIAVLLVFPRHLLRLKPVAMAFLVYVFLLTTLQVQSLLSFHRSPSAKATYGANRINAALAGTIIGWHSERSFNHLSGTPEGKRDGHSCQHCISCMKCEHHNI